MSDLKMLAIAEIKESPVALRAVDFQSEGFIGLVDSIRQKGVMNPISVRWDAEGENYILIDGLHRFSAAREAGLEEIPCNVMDLERSEVLTAQIIANVHRVETKPVEYTKQIFKILAANPVLTISELATSLAKTPSWLSERLGLLKLVDRAQTLVDDGKISLSNAYSLSKLPPEEQPDWMDRAQAQPPQEFLPAINARVKDIKKAKREGRDPSKQEFVAVARIRKLAEIKAEAEAASVGPALLAANNIESPVGAFALAVNWVLHLDPQSIEISKAKEEERKKTRDEQKEKRRMERLDKKAEEATAEASKAKTEDKVG